MALKKIEHFIGIDGGGSGCRVAIADQAGDVLGTGEAGPANASTDLGGTVRNILEALDLAADDAGLADPQLRAAKAHAGIAGAITRQQCESISKALPMDTKVTEDKETALRGAMGERSGILLAIGTGTLIGAVHKENTRFIGGWGFVLSDQASGAWLGRNLLTEVLLCHDGLSAPTDLSRRVLEDFDGDPKAIVSFAATAAPSNFARLAPAIVKAATSGDPLGLNLIQAGSIYLTNAIDAIGLARNDVLCLAGGLGPSYGDWLMPSHQAKLAPPEGTPLDGALALALAQNQS
jgi:glucosamine kinase